MNGAPLVKYVVLLLIVLVVLGLSRVLRLRGDRDGARHPANPSPVGHEDLPACAQCGVYLPRSEALPGVGGVFCCEAHRLAFMARKPNA